MNFFVILLKEFTESAIYSPKTSNSTIFSGFNQDSFSLDNNFDGFSFVKSSSFVEESAVMGLEKGNDTVKYERKSSIEFEFSCEYDGGQIADEKELKEIIMEEYFKF